MDASRDAERTAETGPATGGRLRTIAKILILDVAAPLATYSLLRSAGVKTVTALVLSGVVPALGVAAGIIRHRRLDVVGALVLAGIVVGTVLGLVSHSARLVLMEASVPTAVLGVACLGSLCTRRPLMFSFALEFIGPDTAQGREMAGLWQYERFRRIFRIITTVWGIGFLLEAALRVAIVYDTSTGTALASSTVTPFVWVAGLLAWTVAYGARQKKKGERLAAVREKAQASGAQSRPADLEER
ncbi:MAG TPA: VC0807 family protein [Streptosporangiaceae bacterium]|nr:VC0807 family protein [Streptosporangiaceae bacterium]